MCVIYLLNLIEQNFKINYYGNYGIKHWKRVYENTQVPDTSRMLTLYARQLTPGNIL